MRPLTEEETKTLFQKLAEYMGRSIERLINRSDERHCFRLIKVRAMGQKKAFAAVGLTYHRQKRRIEFIIYQSQ